MASIPHVQVPDWGNPASYFERSIFVWRRRGPHAAMVYPPTCSKQGEKPRAPGTAGRPISLLSNRNA